MDQQTKMKIADLERRLKLLESALKVDGAGNVSLESRSNVAIKGLNVAVQANVNASVTGTANAELKSSGMTIVQGSLVKLN